VLPLRLLHLVNPRPPDPPQNRQERALPELQLRAGKPEPESNPSQALPADPGLLGKGAGIEQACSSRSQGEE